MTNTLFKLAKRAIFAAPVVLGACGGPAPQQGHWEFIPPGAPIPAGASTTGPNGDYPFLSVPGHFEIINAPYRGGRYSDIVNANPAVCTRHFEAFNPDGSLIIARDDVLTGTTFGRTVTTPSGTVKQNFSIFTINEEGPPDVRADGRKLTRSCANVLDGVAPPLEY